VADKQDLKQKMVDKWSIKPSLAEKMVDILEYVALVAPTFQIEVQFLESEGEGIPARGRRIPGA